MSKKQNTAYSVLSRIVKLLVAVVLIMLIYAAALKSYDFGYRIFAEKPVSLAPGQDIVVVVEEGMSTGEIADMLEDEGVIRDAMIFRIQNQLSHYKGAFRAGTYNLNTSMENDEIMAVLSGEKNE